MDDPNLTLEPNYLSYDEQPPHRVDLGAFSMMAETVSAADWAKSGMSGSPEDVSHSQVVSE